VIALVFAYETDDPERFEEVYGATGSWAGFFGGAPGYVGTELLRDVEQPSRYLVVDRWESREAYNAFVEEHRDEYMRRVDETAFLYRQELRLGTFENLWTDEHAGHPAAP
jgi:heme-degrading monooxygenase HmoA